MVGHRDFILKGLSGSPRVGSFVAGAKQLVGFGGYEARRLAAARLYLRMAAEP